MIDEKKLIEEIRNLKKHYDFFYKKGRSEIDDIVKNASDTLFNDIAKIIYEQPKVGEWIPCSERLPDEACDVEVMIDEKELIEQIKRRRDFWLSEASRYDEGGDEINMDICDSKAIELEVVIRMIQVQPKVGEWIPCTEKSPEVPKDTDAKHPKKS